jgi:uncharacterized protein
MLSVAGMIGSLAQAALGQVVGPTEDEVKRMEAAAPAEPQVQPAQPRKVLVWGHPYTHEPVPFASKALEVLGRKSGAYEAVVSDDPTMLLPEKLGQFDALVMNNIHERTPFLPRNLAELPADERAAAEKQAAAIQDSILAFVRGGKGLVGIHAATAALQDWAEYGDLMGGFYTGHITEDVPVKLDEPDHPINACFGGQGFRLRDEIYFLSEPKPRAKYRVLLSLDLSQMADPGQRPDKDYVISLVRTYGKGRVFYCSLGHASDVYWNAAILRHFLAGIQFAIGDLPAEARPR